MFTSLRSFLGLNTSRTSGKCGFTLVEMMVVVAIFLIITSILLANLPAFRDRTSLDLVTKEVVSVLRQMQVYGGASRVGSSVAGTVPRHGLYFSTTQPTQAILFIDKNSNNRYDLSESEEIYVLGGGVRLDQLCQKNAVTPYNCLSVGEIAYTRAVSIIFTNPFAQPTLMVHLPAALGTYDYVRLKFIHIRSGEERYITISRAGQILISTTATP